MTVAQTNISILKTSNRNLQLEVAQQKAYINELEERLKLTQDQQAQLQEEFDAYKEAHPETPPEDNPETPPEQQP